MPGKIRHKKPKPVNRPARKLPMTRWGKGWRKPVKAVSTPASSRRIFLRKYKYNPPMSGPLRRSPRMDVFPDWMPDDFPDDNTTSNDAAADITTSTNADMPTSGQKAFRTKAQPRRRQWRMFKS